MRRIDGDSVISTFKYMMKYILLLGTLLFIGYCTSDLVTSTRELDRTIIRVAINAVDDENTIMHQGRFFAKGQDTYFTAYDEDGNLIDGTDRPDYGLFPTTETVEANGCTYTFASQNIGIDAMVMATLVAASVVMLLFMAHIANIVDFNINVELRCEAIRNIVGTQLSSDLDEILSRKRLKKVINVKLCIIVPAVIALLCCIISTNAIHQYALRLTDRISGVVQHYGVVHSDKTIEAFNALDGIHIDITPSDNWHDILPTTGVTVRNSGTSSGSGFVMRDMIAINHRALNCGRVICVNMNMMHYRNLTLSYLIALFAYYAYLAIKLRENSRIKIV